MKYEDLTNSAYMGITPEMNFSIRDHFAGQALAGMLANPDPELRPAEDIVKTAYCFADWMMKERKRL